MILQGQKTVKRQYLRIPTMNPEEARIMAPSLMVIRYSSSLIPQYSPPLATHLHS